MNNKHLIVLSFWALLLIPHPANALGLTYGSALQFSSSNPQTSTVARIDATRALLVYGDSSINKGYARIATASGNSVSIGSAYQYAASYAAVTNVTMLDSTHAVIVYNDYNSSRTTKVLIATISGSTLAFGSAVSVGSNTNNDIGYSYGIATLDSTHFVLTYGTYVQGSIMMDIPDEYAGYVVAGSVSGTTITMGSAQTFTGSNPRAMSAIGLDATHFVFASSGINKVQAGSVSGTTITLGTAVSCDSGSPFLGKIDSTTFLLNTVTSTEKARIGTMSGTTVSLAAAVSYASTSTSYGATAVLDSTHAMLFYKDSVMPVTMSGTTVTAGTAVNYVSGSRLTYAAALGSGTVIVGFTGSDNKGYIVAGSDISGPVISSLSSTPGSTGATVEWMTNEEASSRIQYGSTASYGIFSALEDTSPRVTSHTMTLTGLRSCATYHYRVLSEDAFGYSTTSTGSTFTTTGCSGSASIESQTGSTLNKDVQSRLTLTGTNVLSLTVPAASTTYDTTFQIMQVDKTSVLGAAGSPSGRTQAGSMFHLLALSGATTAVTGFSNALTLALSYDDADIAGLDESSLTVYRYDGSSWYSPASTVDTVANIVSATTTQFSDFSIFGTASAAPSDNSTSPTGGGSGGGRRGNLRRGDTSHLLLSPAAPRESMSNPMKTRTCMRVMKWFKNDAKMLGRVNERLQKRFGFTCLE